MNSIPPHACHDLVGGQAENRLEARVGVDRVAVCVIQVAAERRALNEPTEPRLTLAEAFLVRSAVGDVASHAQRGHDNAALVTKRRDARVHHAMPAAERHDLEFESRGPSVTRGFDGAGVLCPVSVHDQREDGVTRNGAE